LHDGLIAVSFLAAGAAGVVVSVLSALSTIPVLRFLSVPTSGLVLVILFIVTFLGIGLGLERLAIASNLQREVTRSYAEILGAVTRFERTIDDRSGSLQTELRDISRQLARFRALHNYDEVYAEAISLIRSGRGAETIRATSFGAAGAPQEYLEVLATTIQQQRPNRMSYRVVMGFRLDASGLPPKQYQPAVLVRRDVFSKHDVADRLDIRCIDTVFSLDILLIGTQHLLIAFPTRPHDPSPSLGLRISDRSIVEQVVEWYEEHIWSHAKTVDWEGEVS